MSHLVLHHLPCHHFSAFLSSSSSSSSSMSSISKSTMGASTVEFRGYRNPLGVPWAHLNRTIKCMANPRRVAMVAKQIMRELSDMLLTDTRLRSAILPEAALGADRFLSTVTTISDVELSADLQIAKVYVSIFGDERGREIALSGLKAKARYVRSQLGKRMRFRLTPEIRFIEDDSLERGSRVIAILDKIKRENKKKDAKKKGNKEESTSLPADDEEWEEDDPDEDIIYVR
ncbi:hypothetical protein Cgig2_032579 [Carnegiea gigantea]|uniref:Ribosome-binding factor A n=1 Tax=Carnegiea gigantea TaxID=171969 RepID=A0A9Q1KY01_9CARY|nr:hypothetical protein Cgig2_032579 [Carnegiea gigantea]